VVHWRPYQGWWLVSSGRSGDDWYSPTFISPRPEVMTVKRRQPTDAVPIIAPALPSASVHWPKLVNIREFLTATKYDDGSARCPGYVTVRNRVTSFEVTLYDPDSASRLPARGPTLDQALSLAEQLLAADEAPWEHDAYLAEQLSRRTKKRKKS